MGTPTTISQLAARLGTDKDDFLEALADRIERRIASKNTSECLTLVLTKNGTASETWEPSEGIPYAQRLIAFMRGKDFAGSKVDSALTKEITDLTIDEFNTFYKRHDALIAQTFSEAMLQEPRIQEALMIAMGNSKTFAYASAAARKQVMDVLMGVLKSQAGDVAQVVGAKVSAGAVTAATAAASIPIVKTLMIKLGAMLAVHLKVLLVKLIAIPAVKHAIVILVKKFVIVAIVGGIAKLILAKAGIGLGAAVAIILAPIIAWIIVHEWRNFPNKLAKEVAQGVRNELNRSFQDTNETILNTMYNGALDQAGQQINQWINEDEDIANVVSDLVGVFAGSRDLREAN